MDNLSNKTFALIYENGKYLYTRWGIWEGEENGANLILKEETLASVRYEFHDIAGIDSEHFIIAATGSQFNTSSTSVVSACLCTIGENDAISFGDWITLPFTISHTFFDMDNVGPSQVVMVFSNADSHGITAAILRYNSKQNDIAFGSQKTI